MFKINVPEFRNEPEMKKNTRMFLFLFSTIIIAFILSAYIFRDTPIFIPPELNMEPATSNKIVNGFNSTAPAKYIVLYNRNKKDIPVLKVAYIDENNALNYTTKKISNASNGITIIFELPEETNIKQIIIDKDYYSKYLHNITTTQVELRDSNNKVTWHNTDILSANSRYNYLHIVKPIIRYPIKSQKVCDALSNEGECSQENILNAALQNNTWEF